MNSNMGTGCSVHREREREELKRKQTLIYYDEQMMLHKGLKSHPERYIRMPDSIKVRPERIVSIYNLLKSENLLDQCCVQSSAKVSDEDILLVHTKEVVL